jgi:23S rRNA pseudouridine1911/1915/1917 synthase
MTPTPDLLSNDHESVDSSSRSDVSHTGHEVESADPQRAADEAAADGEEEEELFEHFRFTAESGQRPLRVDKFLFNFLNGVSRNKVQQAAEAGAIRVDGKPVKSNHRMLPGQTVAVVLSRPPREIELLPEDLNLEVVHQDADFVVVNKPAGMVVHPAYGHYSGTLVNGLMHLFQELPFTSDRDRPGLVHRIDKNTSGLLVVAVNDYAMTHLAKQFFDRSTDRRYTAIVWGNLAADEGTITGNIDRSLRDRKVRQVVPDGARGKHAVTHYKVLERFGFATVVECKLETGRTHQIRVHFQYIGHPLFNDTEYGGDEMRAVPYSPPNFKAFVHNAFVVCPRHALHARTLALDHPKTGERLQFSSPLPEDLQALLDKFRKTQAYNPE